MSGHLPTVVIGERESVCERDETRERRMRDGTGKVKNRKSILT